MLRIFMTTMALLAFTLPALAGFDESINNITAPIATLIGNIVFFKVPLFGAQLPLCLLYTSPSPRDKRQSRMPSSA